MLGRLSLISLVFTICVLAAGQVWLSHLRVENAQQVAKLKKEQVLLSQNVQNLKLEFASLVRPDTLRRLAREKLGMHAPSPMQVVKP